MTRLTDIIAIATVFLTPSVVRAQAPELALAPGSRVRVTAPGVLTPARQSGRVLATSRDSLRVQLDGGADSLWLSRALFTELEVNRGPHRSTGKGIVLGMLSGAALGAVIGAATYQPPKPCANCWFGAPDFGQGGQALIAGVAGALVGAVVGAFVGHYHQSDGWERVPPGPLASLLRTGPDHLSVASGGRGAALSLALQF